MNSEQTQTDSSLALLTWLEVNKKRILFAAIGVLVVGCGLYVSNHFAHQKEFDATQALVDLGKIDSVGRSLPIPSSGYFGVADKYSGTHAAERAYLQGAAALFTEMNYPESRNKFDQFITKYPNSAFLSVAEFGKAACLDAMKQDDQALAAYQQIVTRFAGDAVAPQAKIAMGIIYEGKKQPELALKMYEDVMKGQNAFFWSREVSMLRSHLLTEFPHLAEVPAAPKPQVIPGITAPPPAPKIEMKSAPPAPAPPAPAPATKK